MVGSMNSAQYIERLKERLIRSLAIENAPCHTSNSTKTFLRTNRVEFIDWPPYLPDLNPIENLWAWMKRKLMTQFPDCESEDAIIRCFFEIWATITTEMCAAYCGGYERRLRFYGPIGSNSLIDHRICPI